jgi:predicted GNAT superfamily acetyltransferase
MGTATVHGVVEQAMAAAAAAAAEAGTEIVAVSSADDARRVSRVLSEIWATDHDQPLVPAEVIRSLAHVHGYGAMAVSEAEVVGAALGFFGRDGLGFYLHSYIAGVREAQRDGSVGFALKQHQRAWALSHGLTRVTWTFDPLVRRNACFNLTKLGALAVAFHRDFYGSMHDSINAGDRSDRILVEWRLDSPLAVDASEHRPCRVELPAPDGGGVVARLRVGAGDVPEVGACGGAVELIQVPADIVSLRRVDPALALQWRFAVRRTLGAAFDAAARVEGITRDGWYVVRRG